MVAPTLERIILLVSFTLSLAPVLAIPQLSIDPRDNPPIDQAPLYLAADNCVQSAIMYYFDFYQVDCDDTPRLATCVCATTGQALSTSIARAVSIRASSSCKGSNEAAAATSVFHQFCSQNAANGNGPAAAAATGTSGSGGLPSYCRPALSDTDTLVGTADATSAPATTTVGAARVGTGVPTATNLAGATSGDAVATASSAAASSDGLSQESKIGLGVGVGVGVPTLAATVWAVWAQRRGSVDLVRSLQNLLHPSHGRPAAGAPMRHVI